MSNNALIDKKRANSTQIRLTVPDANLAFFERIALENYSKQSDVMRNLLAITAHYLASGNEEELLRKLAFYSVPDDVKK